MAAEKLKKTQDTPVTKSKGQSVSAILVIPLMVYPDEHVSAALDFSGPRKVAKEKISAYRTNKKAHCAQRAFLLRQGSFRLYDV